MRAFFLALALGVLAMPAHAETALLANGSTFKVEAWSVADGNVRLSLRGGGEVNVLAGSLVNTLNPMRRASCCGMSSVAAVSQSSTDSGCSEMKSTRRAL